MLEPEAFTPREFSLPMRAELMELYELIHAAIAEEQSRSAYADAYERDRAARYDAIAAPRRKRIPEGDVSQKTAPADG